MVYKSRDIKDRVAVDDDCYTLIQLSDGRTQIVPTPTEVVEPGTDLNKAFFQLTEDRVVMLLNSIFNDISSNPFFMTFDTLSGVDTNCVWNESSARIEC